MECLGIQGVTEKQLILLNETLAKCKKNNAKYVINNGLLYLWRKDKPYKYVSQSR